MNDSSQNGVPDTSPIERLIRTTRQYLRSSWVATGLGLAIGLLVGTLVTLSLLDLLVPLWPAVRVIALLLVVVPAAWVFAVGVIRPLFRRLRPTHVARRIESHIPGIHNRLVSCIDLATASKNQTYSAAFYRRLVTEALDRIRSFRPHMVVDFLSLRRAGIFAGVSVAAFLIAFFLFSDRLPTAMARIFAPLADIPPASGVKYTVTPGTAKVLRGDDILFVAEVTKGDPEVLTLEMQPEQGEPLVYSLQKHADNSWRFPLTGFEKSFSYRVRGGGTWTVQHQITMVDRPRISELQTAVHYPKYMGIAKPRLGSPQVADVTGPEQSEVEVVVRVKGQASEGVIQLLEPKLQMVKQPQRLERNWVSGKLPTGATPSGVWEWVKNPAASGASERAAGREGANIALVHTEPAAAGEHQHYFTGDPVGLQVQPGETLFADVYIPEDNKPQTIMLQWNDGSGWEHRAFWGAANLSHGTPDTASQRNMGPLPETGKWVRLEAPAKLLDLEGQTIRGMGFTLLDGQCFWGRAGVITADEIEQEVLVVKDTAPLNKQKGQRWSGKFLLAENGFYRVEVKNELGHANQQMKEGRITAIPDNPPQVLLERPGSDITLSQPAKVPLVVAAYDDFGLASLSLMVQKGDSGGFQTRKFKDYDKPRRSDNPLGSLDLTGMNLKPGEHVRYRVEVRDRKGQMAQTQEYVVRIADDQNAADRRLAQFEQSQDTFQEKLVKLIADQTAVTQKVETLEAKYAPLTEKIAQAEAAQEQQRPKPEPAADPTAPMPATPEVPPMPPPLELDAETKKLLEELRAELAEVAKLEAQNAQLGEQVAADVTAMAQEAAAQQLLPQQVVEQIQAVQEGFQNNALEPMKALATDLQQAAQPNQPAPKLEDLNERSEQLDENLKNLQDRLDAINQAGKNAQQDPNEAIAKLERELMRQNADAQSRDLANLRDFLAAQLAVLQRLEGKEEELVESAQAVPESLLPAVENEQASLEEELREELSETRELQGNDRPEQMRRRDPEFPEAPYTPETDDLLVPPEEEDTPEEDTAEPMGEDEAGEQDEADADEAAQEEEEEEELFMPALGGPQPKLDPRFADKQRPLPEKPEDANADPADAQRDNLEERGLKTLAKLDLAGKSVAADQQALDRLMQHLQQALKVDPPSAQDAAQEAENAQANAEQQGQQPPSPPNGQGAGQSSPDGQQPPEGSEEAEAEEEPLSAEEAAQLAELMSLPEMQQAMQMAARLRQMRNNSSSSKSSQQASQPPMTPSRAQQGNLQGTTSPAPAKEEQLAELDLETRTVIMKMQPRVREELLQGMREQGPEGYRKFIQDYFKRLTKVK